LIEQHELLTFETAPAGRGSESDLQKTSTQSRDLRERFQKETYGDRRHQPAFAALPQEFV
jgi:hypothetical protein